MKNKYTCSAKDLPTVIRAIRLNKGVLVSQLAKDADLTTQTMQAIESGNAYRMDVRTIQRIFFELDAKMTFCIESNTDIEN